MAAQEGQGGAAEQGLRSSGASLWKGLRRSPVGLTGAIVVACILLVALFAPALAPTILT